MATRERENRESHRLHFEEEVPEANNAIWLIERERAIMLSNSATPSDEMEVTNQDKSGGKAGPKTQRRRLSPMPYQKQSLLGYVAATEEVRPRRRLPQRWSTTIGWRSGGVTQQEIVEQAVSMCGRYLRFKLRSCITVHKKLGLQRLKSVSSLTGDPVVIQVFTQIRQLADELEKRHPKLYRSVTENVGLQTLTSETVVQNLFLALAHMILGNDITWGRIIALYTVAGSLAMDCVRLGHPEYVLCLVQNMGTLVERDVCQWIAQQGGWKTLITRFKKSRSINMMHLLFAVACLIITLYVLYFL